MDGEREHIFTAALKMPAMLHLHFTTNNYTCFTLVSSEKIGKKNWRGVTTVAQQGSPVMGTRIINYTEQDTEQRISKSNAAYSAGILSHK